MSEILFWLIVSILLVDFVFERILDHLNNKRMSPELPEQLKDLYDKEEYAKSQDYNKEKEKLSFVSEIFGLLVILALLFAGSFGALDAWVGNITENAILQALIFFGVIGILSDIITSPLEIYSIFKIEEKYGFNKTTAKTYVLDKIKSWLLTAVIGGGILSLIIWIYQLTGANFWWQAWVVVVLFSVFMMMFYTSIFLPLFNKLTPLEENELKDKLYSLSKSAGFELDNVSVMDGSKRSTKANAFFSGLGKRKKIVLYDTLIDDLTTDEVTAVMAHEIGHYKLRHTVYNVIISIISSGIMLFLLSLILDSSVFSSVLGSPQPSFHINVLVFGLLYSPVSFVLNIFVHKLSRKNEYEADAFASKYCDGEALISGLKKLSVKSLSNLLPHPLYVFFNYSHPTLLQRMAAIRKK